MINTVFSLLKKDILLELRQKHTFYRDIALYRFHHICACSFLLVTWNRMFGRVFLGNTTICMLNAGGKKLFTGKQRQDALLLFYRFARRIYHCQDDLQYFDHAVHEFAEPCFIFHLLK
jgi:hypothetical protein